MEPLEILFDVRYGNSHVIVWCASREEAKRQARVWLGHTPDDYIVTPLTERGDRVKIAVTLFV